MWSKVIMKSMYNTKKKREVDPNAPPRPTLLGHEKEMKQFRQQYQELSDKNTKQESAIISLERKISRLQSQVDAMTSIINRSIRN